MATSTKLLARASGCIAQLEAVAVSNLWPKTHDLKSTGIAQVQLADLTTKHHLTLPSQVLVSTSAPMCALYTPKQT